MNATGPARRNFGPRLDLMLIPDRILPRAADGFLHGFYAVVGLVLARRNIRHSREYLKAITGRPATLRDVWRHYSRLIECLHRKLRAGAGEKPDVRVLRTPGVERFEAMARSDEPALFGTFHVGDSDLIGFALSESYSRRVAMVRLRVGNSSDMDRLARGFDGAVRFIWVNRPDDFLLALKDALTSGESVALQCDRPEHTTRLEPFPFLGARRLFPFSIYHLAVLFGHPVVMSFATTRKGVTSVNVSDVFRPDASLSREENLAVARAHFAGVLASLESELRRDPTRWFNFTPLNPAVPEVAA